MPVYLIIVLNLLAVVAGTAIGCFFRKYISWQLQDNFMIYFSIISTALGIQLLGRVSNLSAVVLTFLLSGLLGHAMQIDKRVGSLAGKGESQNQSSTSVILVAFTLFCASTSGILGALDLGFSGDTTLLITKATMDFLAALFFASASGWTIAVIAVPLGVILGAFYLLSTQISPYLSVEMIGNFSAYGGFIQFLNALRIIKLKDPPVLDMLPGMILIFPITYFWPC